MAFIDSFLSDVLVAYILVTVFLVALMYRLGAIRFSLPTARLSEETEKLVFLFEGRSLVDATGKAREILDDASDQPDDWAALITALGPRFDDLQTLEGRLDTCLLYTSDAADD